MVIIQFSPEGTFRENFHQAKALLESMYPLDTVSKDIIDEIYTLVCLYASPVVKQSGVLVEIEEEDYIGAVAAIAIVSFWCMDDALCDALCKEVGVLAI